MRLVAWNALLTVILGLIALAGAEAYLRSTIGPMREGQLFEYRADSKRLKVMKPGMHMNIYGVEVQTNDLGFRDNRARVPPKAPGEFRIIVLGDSFTFGPGIDYEHLYTSLLREHLQRRHPQVTVINLAVEGYNIIQYAAVLEEVGLSLEPDALLVSLFPVNDFDTPDRSRSRCCKKRCRAPPPTARTTAGTRTSPRYARSPPPPRRRACRSPSRSCRTPGASGPRPRSSAASTPIAARARCPASICSSLCGQVARATARWR
ncbi:MAG: hypothetical protein JF611_17080 [Betaproteobacteria bacterium]|nr:hypothetical protein [Betaproteobacteria bacterium]